MKCTRNRIDLRRANVAHKEVCPEFPPMLRRLPRTTPRLRQLPPIDRTWKSDRALAC